MDCLGAILRFKDPPSPPPHQKKRRDLPKSSKKEVKEQEINGAFVFKLNTPQALR